MLKKNMTVSIKIVMLLLIFVLYAANQPAWSAEIGTGTNGNIIQYLKWTQQNSNTSKGLNDVYFYDQDYGLASGDSGVLCLTRDGGENWFAYDFSNRLDGDYDLIDVWMTSANVAFFIGIEDSGCTIQKFYFNNQNIVPKYLYSTKLYNLFFINDKNGWAVGEKGTVLFTNNSFDSYKENDTTYTDMDLYGVHFVNSDTGWVVGENGTIMKSVDGGKTWQAQNSTIIQNLYAVHFIDSQHGLAIGHNGDGVRTMDGGHTWSYFSTGEDLDCYAIHFINDSTGWTVGLSGNIYTSSDSGFSWSAENLPVSDAIGFYGLSVIDNEHIWAVGDRGVILHRGVVLKPVPPDPVTDLHVRTAGANFISLTWTNPQANWSKTEIWRGTTDVPSKPHPDLGVLIYSGTNGYKVDEGLAPNRRYYYGAFAYNVKQDTFSLGNGARLKADTYPAVVSNFRAEATGPNTVSCNWNNPQDGSHYDSVKVVRATNGFPISLNDINATLVYRGRGSNFTDTTGLTQGTTYYYVAFTIGFSGLISTHENARWQTQTGTIRPDAISRFSASARGPRSVFLQWHHPTQNWLRTEIWSSTKNHPEAPDTTQGKRIYSGTDTTATDTTVLPNRAYYYSAFAINSFGQHSLLTKDSRATAITYPAQVINFAATAKNANTIECTWINPNTAEFDSVKLYRNRNHYKTSLTDGTGSLLYAGKGSRFTDMNLFPDSTYYYSVFTIGFTGLWKSPAENARAFARTPRATAKPEPISDLNATVLSPYSIALTWRNPQANYAGTRIVRKLGDFPKNPQDGQSVYQGWSNSFTDSRLTPATTYYYAAFAYNSDAVFSDLGTTSTTRALTAKMNPPVAIRNLRARSLSYSAIRLTWKNPASNYSGTVIRRHTGRFPTDANDGTFVYNGTDTVVVDDKGVRPYITYFYSAFAYNKWNEYSPADTSAQDSAVTLPPPQAPGQIMNFAARAVGPRQVNLVWQNPSDTLYYLTEIRRKADGYPISPEQGDLVYKNNGTSTVDVNPVLSPGTRYFYSAFSYSTKDQYAYPAFASTITWGQSFTWSLWQSPAKALTAIYFYNSTNGWAVGPSGSMLYTIDGGKSWKEITTIDKKFNLTHIYFYDLRNGWCIGTYNGRALVLVTVDGGLTWKPYYSNLSKGLTGVYFFNSTIGWAVGEDGVILKTFDGGQTWARVSFNYSFGINAVQFLNSLTGWAVGSSGAILYTLDGGLTWSALNNIVTRPLRNIRFFDNRYGWAVGDKGTLIFTSDGGRTWNYSAITDTFDIRNVHFVNSNVGFIIADTDKILKTLDGGKTWTVESQGSGVRFTSFSFVDDKTGYVVADNGAIIQLKFTISPPATITGLTATQNTTSSVQLGWSKPATVPAGMVVIRSTKGYPVNTSDGVQVYNGADNTFTDTNLRAGITYYYTVFAYNTQGAYSSAQSSAQTSITLSDYLGPFGYKVNIAGIDAMRYPSVTAFVSVVDTVNRKIVTGLAASNFKVLDDSVQAPATVNKLSPTNGANLDLVFVVDATASMTTYIDTLAQNIPALVDSFKAVGITGQFACVAFGDSVREILQPTKDAVELRNWLKGLLVKGGGTPQDNVLEALARASALPIRENALSVLVLLTDAEYYEWGMSGDGATAYTTSSLIQRLQEQFHTVYAIAPQREKYHQIASSTGGYLFDIASGVTRSLDLIRQILGKIYLVKYTSPQVSTPDSWHKLATIVTKDNSGGIGRSRYYIGPTTLRVNPVNFMAIKGMNFQVELAIRSVLDLQEANVTLKYRCCQMKILPLTIKEGDFLKSGNGTTRFKSTITDTSITFEIKRQSTGGVSGSGVLASLQFHVVDSLITRGISVLSYNLMNTANKPIQANIQNSSFKSAHYDSLVADFDDDQDIDTHDFALFATYWKPTNLPKGDIGPAAGSAPFLTPAQDAQVNYEDLFVFTQMWNWYHAAVSTGSLGKILSETPRMLLKWGKRDATQPVMPVEWVIENAQNLAMAHVLIHFDPSQYRLGRVHPGNAFQADGANVSFFVTEDVVTGRIEISTSQLLEHGITGFNGTGTLATIELEPIATIESQFPLILEAVLRDGANQDQVFEIINDPGISQLPKTTELYANYPNPFNPVTHIDFDLARLERVELSIYNLLGQQVRALVNKRMEPGRYELLWDGRNDAGHALASGTYIYRMQAGNYVKVRRMVLLK